MITGQTRLLLGSALTCLLFLRAQSFAPENGARTRLAPDSFARAIASHNARLLDLCQAQGADVNARAEDGRSALLIATEKRDAPLVRRLLALGANAEAAGGDGRTPLIAATTAGDLDLMRTFLARGASSASAVHHAIIARQHEALALLLASAPQSENAGENSEWVESACETGDAKIITAVLQESTGEREWTRQTSRVLETALRRRDADLTRLLLSKHSAPPIAREHNIPLLAQAIADDDLATFRALLSAGADPNTVLPAPCDKVFVASLPAQLRGYVKGDQCMTVLMLAAGAGKPEFVRTLLDAGTDRNRLTSRYKMLALYFAAQTEKWKCVQMLLGGGPVPEKLRIEISLRSQRAAVIRDGQSIFETQCSTGREGFATPAGQFVITDKTRIHISSIYKVEMPYFMRLNCLDFGMHEGVVPNRPASHGCIRLPSAAARKLFSEIPVGTVVMIN